MTDVEIRNLLLYWAEAERRYESYPGDTTRHACPCKRDTCRRDRCRECWGEVIAWLEGQGAA